MRFVFDVVPVQETLVVVPAQDIISTVPVQESLSSVQPQVSVIDTNTFDASDNDNDQGYWVWGDGEWVLFGSGDEVAI